MDYPNNNTEPRKNKHLNFEERMLIQLSIKDGFSPYKIAKELKRPINTILNEIRRGTTTQVKQGKYVEVYLADTGEAVYKKHRINCCRTFKRLECSDFINYTVDKIKNHSWSPDACVGEAIATGRFNLSQMVCTKTLYNHIYLGLLDIKNTDLPMKLRRNTKSTRVKKHKKKLGSSISDRPIEINTRDEFGHWEIDTVIGQKSNTDNVLLTIVERKTRYTMVVEIMAKTAEAVTADALDRVRSLLVKQFSQVFKTITGDNGSEFANLSTLETETDTKVYNEHHNGLIRRFIPKGNRISD